MTTVKKQRHIWMSFGLKSSSGECTRCGCIKRQIIDGTFKGLEYTNKNGEIFRLAPECK